MNFLFCAIVNIRCQIWKSRRHHSRRRTHFDSRAPTFFASLETDGQESGYDIHVCPCVPVQLRRREHSAAGQSKRQQELIGQMLADRGFRRDVRARFLDGLRCNALGACSESAKSAKQFRHPGGSSHFDQHDISRSDGISGFDNLHAFLLPIQQVRDGVDLASCNRGRQVRDDCQYAPTSDFAALCQVNRRQAFARFDGRSEATASCGIETVSLQVHSDFRARAC